MTAAATLPAWASHWTRVALTELPADITTATPAQVDEVIRTVELERHHLGPAFERATDAIRKAIGEEAERVRVGRRYESQWPTDWVSAEKVARALPADTPSQVRMAGYYGNPATIGEALAVLDELRAVHAEMTAVAQRGHDEFDRRGGWTRFYKVDNSGGHVHTTTGCRTTYASTAWAWPTQLSGADGAGVVEAAGPLTCLVCFPGEREDILAGRPVRFDAFETPEQRDERVRREEALATRNAAKIAKGVTPDGKPLNIGRVDGLIVEVKTERAAELRYVEFAANAEFHQHMATRQGADRAAHDLGKAADFAGGAQQLAQALAWKRGVTAAELVASLADKVGKKTTARIKRGW